MTILERLGGFVADASAARLDAVEQGILRRHFADAMVSAVAGSRTGEAADMRPLFSAEVADRIGLLAACIRLTEIDDIHLPSCTTPSSAIAPVAALLCADETASASARVEDAYWAGLEVMVRFAVAAQGPRILYRGVWPTYLAAPLGSAAAASRVLGLDAAQATNALSIALNLTAAGAGRFPSGRTPRWLLHAQAVRSGVFAARAAAEGYSCDLDLLDRPWLRDSHGIEIDPEPLTARLGQSSVYPELSLKPWCSAKQAIAAIAGMLDLTAKGMAPDDITAIAVRVPPVYAQMIGARADPARRSSTFASVRYQLALAAFHPETLTDIARDALPWNDRIEGFMERITVEPDDALSRLYPRRWPARLEIETLSGPKTVEIIDAAGDPSEHSRFDDAALADKARRVLDRDVAGPSADRVLEVARSALTDRKAANRLAEFVASID